MARTPSWAPNDNVTVIKSRPVQYLLMKLRDRNTVGREFMVYADRLMRLLAEEALCRLPSIAEDGEVETPVGTARGLVEMKRKKICVVSVVRSGDILMEAVRQVEPGVAIGKILIQRDETRPEKLPELFYQKLPRDIAERFVILVDPLLATAGSAKMALNVLTKAGVAQHDLMFLNLICCPEGLANLYDEYPNIKVVTGAVDDYLNDQKFVVPGLGDYGDRYYQTE